MSNTISLHDQTYLTLDQLSNIVYRYSGVLCIGLSTACRHFIYVIQPSKIANYFEFLL